jgi:protein TonB
MATRAFLLCGDEKAVQAVTQILDELEVSFEHSSEPAFSLKRLATQRFDLLIVDCDNAQNATQVFNSARASNFNKTSIAIAIVEGKAGVPNAFRLGASLVLTKPVSLEQARNTLRTGIGMTRKDAQEVKPPAPAITLPGTPAIAAAAPAVSAPTPVPTVTSVATVQPPRPPATPAVLTPVAPPVPPAPKPIAETPKPAAPPAPPIEKAPVVTRPAMVPLAPQEHKPALTNFTETKDSPAITPTLAKSAAATAGPAPAPKNFDSVFKTPALMEDAKSNASAPKADSKGTVDKGSPTLSIVDPLAEEDALDPVRDHGVPSFGAMGKDSFAGLNETKSSGGKGWLIAAIVLVLIGAGGYGAWTTQPELQKFVAWEYLRTMSKIAELRGQPQTVAQTSVSPAPSPAPVVSPPALPTPDPATTATAMPDPSGAASEPAQTANTQNTNSSVTDTTTPKQASVQPAKETTGNHAAGNPTLVPTSLPATPVAKSPSNELLEVPEDFADDQIVRRVHPTYPKQARARKVQGTVVLEAIVNKKGTVDSLQLVSGDSLLAQAAADAVKQWKYKPYFHNGEPTEFQTRITIDFKLP